AAREAEHGARAGGHARAGERREALRRRAEDRARRRQEIRLWLEEEDRELPQKEPEHPGEQRRQRALHSAPLDSERKISPAARANSGDPRVSTPRSSGSSILLSATIRAGRL